MAKAKFTCVRKEGVETFTVGLEPVLHLEDRANAPTEQTLDDGTVVKLRMPDGSVLHPEADKSFFAGYPYGTIVLGPLTPEAAAAFEVGKVTTVDFTLGG